VYIPNGKVHGQVNGGAEELALLLAVLPPPEYVGPEPVTVEGFDEHL